MTIKDVPRRLLNLSLTQALVSSSGHIGPLMENDESSNHLSISLIGETYYTNLLHGWVSEEELSRLPEDECSPPL